MRKRWLLLGAVDLARMGLAGWLFIQPEPAELGVTRENFGRVRKGMTLEQVSAILGEPTGWFDAPPCATWVHVTESNFSGVAITFTLDDGEYRVADGHYNSDMGLIPDGSSFVRLGDDTFAARLRRLLPW